MSIGAGYQNSVPGLGFPVLIHLSSEHTGPDGGLASGQKGHCSCGWAQSNPLLGGTCPTCPLPVPGRQEPWSLVLNALFPLGQCGQELLSSQITRV